MDQPAKQTALPDTANIDIQAHHNTREIPPASGCSRRQTVWQWIIVFCITLALVNVFILYILHFEHNPFTSAGTTAVKLKNNGGNLLSATSSQIPGKNQGLSYNTKGKIVSGAGTCVYLKAGSFDQSHTLRYINSAPIAPSSFNDVILVSYVMDTTGTITTAQVNSDNQVTIANPDSNNQVTAKNIRGIATLSSNLAIALVQANFMFFSYIPVTINSNKNIQMVKNNEKQGSTTSAFNSIGRLSDHEFVTAYYGNYSEPPQYQYLIIGTVDSNNQITFSDKLQFGNPSGGSPYVDTVFGVPVPVTVNGNPSFAIPWYSSYDSTNASISTSQSLCVLVGKHGSAGPEKLFESCTDRYHPAYRADNTIAISSTKIAMAVYDKKSNYGVVVIIAEVTGNSVNFGADALVPGSDNGKFVFYGNKNWSPSASLTLLSNDRIAVAFHDSGNDGVPSTAIFAISSSNRLTLVSPVVPYTTSFLGFSTPTDAYYSTTINVGAFNQGRYFAGFLGPKDKTIQSQASVVQSSNPAIGIVAEKSGSSLKLAMNGMYDGLSDLTPGYTYYVTGTGEIRGCDASANAIGSNAVKINNELIISNDARIGIATDDDVLLLLPGSSSAAAAA